MRKLLLGLAVAAMLAGPSIGGAVHADEEAGPCHAAHDPALGGDWTAFGRDLSNTRSQPDENGIGPAQAASLTKAWATTVGQPGASEGALNAAPTEADGCVFVGTATGTVAALDAATGRQLWATTFTVASPGLGGTIVGATVVDDGKVFALVNETGDGAHAGPYVAALDEQTGTVDWRSDPISTYPGAYTNASPAVIDDMVFAGWSPPEGDSHGQGGFALVSTAGGSIVKRTETIPAADQAKGYAGGGIWSAPAYDEDSGYAFVGAGNPDSKTLEHPNTNAVLKIDMHPGDHLGEIVGAYKGVVDQYNQTLQTASQSPVCQATDNLPVPVAVWTFDDPACGQLDLDFGEPPNLFKVGGRTLVGALQKAGIYHVFDEGLAPVWRTVVGGPCALCNAGATAVGPDGVAGVSAPGGTAFSLARDTGSLTWAAPIGDGAHYEGTSVADGVVYTLDNEGFLDVLNAGTGALLARHPVALDTQSPSAPVTSSGVSIARHTVFVGASSGPPGQQAATVVAYRAAT